VLSNERGFTLVELIAVLIVLAVITTVVVIKFNLFTGSATQQMIDHSIGELNNREKMVWTNLKLSFYEGEIDVEVQRIMNEKYMDLGNGTQVKDGVISVRGEPASIQRAPASRQTPAIWSRQ